VSSVIGNTNAGTKLLTVEEARRKIRRYSLVRTESNHVHKTVSELFASTEDREHPGFNKGVRVPDIVSEEASRSFLAPVIKSTTYITLDRKQKFARCTRSPGLKTPVQTGTPITIRQQGDFGSSITTYGEFVVTVDNTDGIPRVRCCKH
jgi:hypothetical protein